MIEKGFGYNAQLPYEQLKKDFNEAVRNPDIFEAPKIKIIRGQTGLGKSGATIADMGKLKNVIKPRNIDSSGIYSPNGTSRVLS